MAWLNPEDYYVEIVLLNGDKELKRKQIDIVRASRNKRKGTITLFFKPVVFLFDDDDFVTHYGFAIPLWRTVFGKCAINEHIHMGNTLTITWGKNKPSLIMS